MLLLKFHNGNNYCEIIHLAANSELPLSKLHKTINIDKMSK